jgi:VIT1/CCC1 family predicted Fe2+/Mn2+ transporter
MTSGRADTADRADLRRVAVFGAADGLGIVLGLIAGMIVSHQPAHAVWAAALSGGVAEFFSMANGQRISDCRSGWLPPLAIGAASLVGCALPAVPYSLSSGATALTLALALCAAVAGVISWARPEKGVLAVVETFGLLLVTGVACGLVGLWLR